VIVADGRHLDDLPADELDAVSSIEDSDFRHPVVLVQRESSPGQLDIDRHAVMVRAPAARSSMANVRYPRDP
jgi:hypothetical protein